MTGRATVDGMGNMHGLLVESLTKIITEGIPQEVNGEIVFVPAPPAYYAQAVKMLKDNDITAILTSESPLAGLIKSLPTFSDEEGELPTATH